MKIIRSGESYGRTGSLINKDKDRLVEFYDMTSANRGDFGEFGQMVSRYNLQTIMEAYDSIIRNGLNLHGDTPAWKVSPAQMKYFYDHIIEIM